MSAHWFVWGLDVAVCMDQWHCSVFKRYYSVCKYLRVWERCTLFVTSCIFLLVFVFLFRTDLGLIFNPIYLSQPWLLNTRNNNRQINFNPFLIIFPYFSFVLVLRGCGVWAVGIVARLFLTFEIHIGENNDKQANKCGVL